MSGNSPYLNPQWPEADWDVSGAFTHDRELLSFFDYCRLLLGFEPFHMVHGAPLCLWNSGRVLQHLLRSAEEIRAAGLAYEARKIAVFLTFTNLALQEEHLKDPWATPSALSSHATTPPSATPSFWQTTCCATTSGRSSRSCGSSPPS